MTSNPPPKITSVPAGTPSGEWANKTDNMLQSTTIPTDPAMKQAPKSDERPAAITTPGHEFPGSYPKELEEEQQRESRDNGSEGSPMASVVHAAKQYMPDNVERTVEYASQRAAAYLPIPRGIKNTVTSYWYDQRQNSQSQDPPLSTSLPSSETKGAQPFEHVGGVGSLPGTLSESSVALLPDERAARTPVGKDGSQTQGNNQVKGTAFSACATGTTEAFVSSKSPLSEVQSSQDKTRTETQQVGETFTTTTDARESDTQKPCEAPKEQRSSSSPHIADTAVGRTAVGAGSAARHASEPVVTPYATVATPEGQGSRVVESGRHQAQDQAQDLPRGEAATAQDTPGAGVLGGAVGASELSNDDREHKQAKSVSRETQLAKGSNAQQEAVEEGVKHNHNTGAGTGAHDPGSPPGIRAHEAEAQQSPTVSPTSATITSATDSHKEPKERRVSFLHKVRGEVKVIAGKISGKEQKVEEGRRIIHGEL